MLLIMVANLFFPPFIENFRPPILAAKNDSNHLPPRAYEPFSFCSCAVPFPSSFFAKRVKVKKE